MPSHQARDLIFGGLLSVCGLLMVLGGIVAARASQPEARQADRGERWRPLLAGAYFLLIGVSRCSEGLDPPGQSSARTQALDWVLLPLAAAVFVAFLYLVWRTRRRAQDRQ